MADRLSQLRAAITRPLPLAYHPLYRFYEGGSLTRQFRGLPDRPDDWWSETGWARVPRPATAIPTAAPRA
jgi:hypothetical protein